MAHCARTRLTGRHATFAVVLLISGGPFAAATPPTIFNQPAYESPVRGDPGDLLMLPGDGFATTDTVVYQALTDTTQPLAAPTAIPTTSDVNTGVAPVVSVLNVPHSLTVSLPATLQTDQSYVIWVRNANGEWSNGIRINDARPLWITPDSAYVTAANANLPRYLKVVGRNLQPAPGAATQVELLGPSTYILTAANDGDPTTAIERYVARVTLPGNMAPGSYMVQVSRDGTSWLNVASGQTLVVKADPVAPATFSVGDSAYGGCIANDGVDDTPCIVKAIAAARNAGGGSVVFGPGVWDMSNDSQTGVVTFGVLVPVGINIIGAGASSTTIQRDTTWRMQRPIFTLQGHNTVQDITFKDAYVYQPTDSGRMLLELGVNPISAQFFNASDPSNVSGVTITQNVFDQPFVGIQDNGMPIDHLFVTNNDFGAYDTGLFLASAHSVSDSVVAYNTFEPGSYIDVAAGGGAIPTRLSAGQRVDFSNNIADGTSTRFLYNPATDAKGFRAAFFWSLLGDHEEVLVSQNTATCSGDKAGDGEAIAFDGNSNTDALPVAQPLLAATANSVTVQGPLLTLGSGTTYTELWIQIAKGTGIGQVRPVIAYSSPTAQTVTFTVSPAWDVPPGADSLVTTAKEYWQVYTVDNFVDQRQPECQKSNANEPSGGVIGIWAGSSDSVIEGNQQYDTSGILFNLAYFVQSTQYGTAPATGYQTFLDIRNNTVDGEYAWSKSCSYSGIRGWYGASPDAPSAPPIESYGVSIAHNTVTQADDLNGGAIALSAGWYGGPPPATWQYAENTMIFGNVINNITNPPSAAAAATYANCGQTYPRLGIHFDTALVWHSILSGNSCNNVAANVKDQGTATLRVCPINAGGYANSCECAPYVQGNEATAAASSGLTVIYPTAQTATDLSMVIVNWSGTAQVTSVVDTSGNTYVLLSSPRVVPASVTQSLNVSQAIYYAKNIAAAVSNTVTVSFNASVTSLAVRVIEYQGLDPSNPIDATVASYGAGGSADSGWVTTSSASDLLIGVGLTGGGTAGAGTGYTARDVNNGEVLGSDIVEDQFVTTAGAYDATMAVSPTSWWVMQFVALRLAGGSDSNTQALTAPSGLTATAASSHQVNLSWTGSTDNIGVSGYLIERCTGATCANFAQIANVPSGTSYSDDSLTPSTPYTYRVRATDVATLMSSYSATAAATTPAGNP
jgi:hypothetical protein